MENLQSKIDASIELLRKGERLALALNPTDGYFVGFSGGKDSQVLLDLVKRSGVKYKAVYSVTTIDPPENVYFIRRYYPDVQFHHPRRNFFKMIETKGLPTVFHRFCCDALKENVGAGNVVLTGVRREESRKRAAYVELMIKSRRKEHADRTRTRTLEEVEQNEHRCIKGKDKVMLNIMLDWTEKDVWKYIKLRGLPINPCYKTAGRVGCMFCPFNSRQLHEYWEVKYPRFKEHIISSLEVYLGKRKRSDEAGFANAEEYYRWWASKKKIKDYLKEHKQINMKLY